MFIMFACQYEYYAWTQSGRGCLLSLSLGGLLKDNGVDRLSKERIITMLQNTKMAINILYGVTYSLTI